jgi:hypothetical protein
MASVMAERILLQLRAAELRPRAMPHSTEFLFIYCYLRLCAIPPSVKFKSKICCIAGSRESALCGILRSQHRFANISANFATLYENILTRWSVAQVGLIDEKKPRVENLVRFPF